MLAVFTLDIGDSCSFMYIVSRAFCSELVANHYSEGNGIILGKKINPQRKDLA